jgi:hypothetical protein
MPAQPATVPSVRDKVTAEEWQARVDLAAMYRLTALYHWDDLVFTHISMRVPGADHHFLINPFGHFFEEITASSLVKVDINGTVVMETPYFINPAGFTIHSAVKDGQSPDPHLGLCSTLSPSRDRRKSCLGGGGRPRSGCRAACPLPQCGGSGTRDPAHDAGAATPDDDSARLRRWAAVLACSQMGGPL